MSYKEALTITRNFTNTKVNDDGSFAKKTEAEMKEFGEACLFLKSFAK